MGNAWRAALLGLGMAALPGCLEEEVSIDLREDGTGTAVLSGKMTEAGTRIIAVMDEPGGGVMDLHLGPDDFSFRSPEDAAREALATKGLRVKECVSRRDAKEVSARLVVEFDRVESLGLLEDLRRRGGTSGREAAVGKPRFELAPAPEGTWTLSVSTPSIEMSGGSGAGAAPGEKPDHKKLVRKLHAAAELAQEGLRGKGRLALSVPGEVLEASPEAGMTRVKGRCAWELDLQALLNVAVSQGWDPGKEPEPLPPVTFRVRFRLPPGKAFPATAVGASAAAPVDAKSLERFIAEVDRVYDGLPRDLDFRARKVKLAEMEGFRKSVEADLPARLPLLREALRDEKRNPYFSFEGAGFLVEHAQGKEDLLLAALAASRCRTGDVGEKSFFTLCHRLCREDVDAHPVVMRILEAPGFSTSTPDGSVVLHQDSAVLLCVLENGEERWVKRFLERLPGEKEPTAACTILYCLAQAATPEADAAVRAVAGDGKADPNLRMVAGLCVLECRAPELPAAPPTKTRGEFEEFLAKAEAEGLLPADGPAQAMVQEALHHVQAADAPRIRALRRMTARRASADGLRDIAFLTGLLRRAVALGK